MLLSFIVKVGNFSKAPAVKVVVFILPEIAVRDFFVEKYLLRH